jgi:aminopeptidase N
LSLPPSQPNFFSNKQLSFHDASGAGYFFLADDVITLDTVNPILAARLVQPIGAWRRHDPARHAADAARARARPRHPRSQQKHLRDGVEEPRLAEPEVFANPWR